MFNGDRARKQRWWTMASNALRVDIAAHVQEFEHRMNRCLRLARGTLRLTKRRRVVEQVIRSTLVDRSGNRVKGQVTIFSKRFACAPKKTSACW